MRLHSIFKKYRYLMRSTLSIVCALCIPACIFAIVLVNSSARELERQNNSFYIDTTESFMLYFNQQLVELRAHAYSLGIDHAYTRSNLASLAQMRSPYEYAEAIRTLSDYKLGLQNVELLGLRFDGVDTIVTSMYKYTPEDFYRAYIAGSENEYNSYAAFMDTESTASLRFFSTFNTHSYRDARMFIGIPVAYADKETALVFYALGYASLAPSRFASQGAQNAHYRIYDGSGQLLYESSPPALSEAGAQVLAGFAAAPDDMLRHSDSADSGFTAFKTRNAATGLTFVSVVPLDNLEKNLLAFSRITQRSLVLLVFGLTAMLVLAVYINYRPIADLLGSLRRRGLPYAEGEILSIAKALEHMEETVSEQRIILMDYILANLLHGIPIPAEDARRLDASFGEPMCVLTIAGAQLDQARRAELTALMESTCGARVFILDVLIKSRIVLVCIPADEDTAALTRTLRQFLTLCGQGGAQVGTGHLVRSPDEIHASYLQSVATMEAAVAPSSAAASGISEIEGYPAEDILLFLNHIRNGETDTALALLDRIAAQMDGGAASALLMRYMCYDLLTAYVRCVQSIGYTLAEWETAELLAHHDLPGLCAAMNASVRRVGAFIARSQEESYRSLEREIIEYINAHFTQPDFGRTTLADHFGISVYALSRLIKDSLGVGLKEYVTARRIELARHLLLTTDDTILSVSTSVGFASPDYFSRVFKAYYGQTPSRLRTDSPEGTPEESKL